MARNSSSSSIIVVVPLPAQGHTPPLICLSRKLAEEGFSIVLVNIESVHRQLAEKWKSSPPLNIRLEPLPFSGAIPKKLDDRALDRHAELQQALYLLHIPLEELLVTKLTGDEGLEIKCIISDFHVTWTSPVAEKLEIPQVCFWSGSTAWALVDYHVPLLDKLGYIPVGDASPSATDDATAQAENIISFIPGLDPFPAYDLPFYLHEFMKMNMDRFLRKYRHFATDKWFLANTFEELEPRETKAIREIMGGKFLQIGPLLPLTPEELDQVVSMETEELDCLNWLDSRPRKSVLYVSFGSLASLSQEQFQELALGLEHCAHSFLWVIRPASLPDNLSPDFFQDFAARIAAGKKSLIVAWVPQQRVLSHDSIAAFLTHCGWNSILESIWSGVPMLGWPCHSEQNLNCRIFIEGKEIGARAPRALRTDLVTRERVEAVVQYLMEEKSSAMARKSVRKLRDAARAAVMDGGSSQRAMNFFVENLKSINLE